MSTWPIIEVIDDNEVDQFIAFKTIKALSSTHQLLQFNSAGSALTFFKQHLSITNNMPDIIFLDISMPELDGWGFLERFDKDISGHMKKEIKIYMLTSSSSNEDKARASDNKWVHDFFVKPITPEKIAPLMHSPQFGNSPQPPSPSQNFVFQNHCSVITIVNKAPDSL